MNHPQSPTVLFAEPPRRRLLERRLNWFGRSVALLAALSVPFSQCAWAATDTWSGNTSNDWNGSNWTGADNPPHTGDALSFGAAGSAGASLTDSLTSTTFNIAGITFSASAPAYTMTGNSFMLTAGITNGSSMLQTINNTGVTTVTGDTGGTLTQTTGISLFGSYTFAVGGATAGITLAGLQFVGTTNASNTTTVNGTGGTLTIGYLGLGSQSSSRLAQIFNGTGNISVGTIAPGGSVSPTTDSFTYAGTGTMTITGVATGGSTFVDTVSSGTLLLSGGTLQDGLSVSGNANFTENSAGTLSGGANGSFAQTSTGTSNLAGMNSYSGATSISAGIVNLTGTESASALTVSGGAFNESGLISGGSITVSGGAFNESSPGVISSTVMFTQTGGTIDLQDANTTTGNITVNAGTFTVDSTGGTTANVLKSNGNSVFMGGGTMNFLLSSNSTANTENIYQTEFTAASSSVIEITQNGNSGASLINLGNTTAWTRNAGSIVDFGTVPAGELENTAAKADAINGVLTNSTTGVAFATTGGGAAWATINTSTGVIGSLTSFAGSYGSTANISVGTSDTSSTGANTLTFNGAGDTVNFTGATTTITTGGILVTPSATGASSITGGAIQGGTGKELVVINNEPSASGAFTISSVIQDNTTASALTIGGTGTTILTNANTFSGVTNITTSGNLQLGNANALQDSTLVFNPTTTSAGLTFSSGIGTFTIAGLTGSTNTANILTLKDVGGTAVNLQVGNNNTSSSFTGAISSGTLTKIGTGTLTLNSGNNITSAVVVNAGSVFSSNTVPLQNVPSVTINNGGVVYYSRGSVAIASGAATDTVTINSGGILSSDFDSGSGSADTAIGAITMNGGTLATRNQLTTGEYYYDRGSFGLGTATGTVAGTAAVTAGGGTNPTSTISAVNVGIRETGGTIFNVMAGSGAGGSLGNPGGIDLLFSGTILSRSNNANTALIKQGNGVMALTGSNAFITPVQISAGTLEINTIANGGVQTTGVGSSGGTSITVTSATGLAAGEAVGGNASSNINAGSTIGTGYTPGSTTVPISTPTSGGTLPGAVNTTLNFGVANSLGISTNAASNLIINGGTLQYVGTTAGSTDRLFQIGASADTAATTATIDSSSPTADTLTFTNTGAITYGLTNKADTLTFQGSNTGANTFDPVIGNNGTGNVSVVKTGAGEWILGGINTYSGGTTVNGGILQYGGSGTLAGTTGAVAMGGGTLDLGATSQTVGAVTITAAPGSGNTIQNGTLTATSYAASNSTGTAVVTAKLGGATATLTKTGNGTLTLSGANPYGGATSVSAGTLIVSGALSGTPTVNVNAGTLQVSQTGLYTNAINSAATLSLGATAAATFAMSNDGTNNAGTTQSSQTFASLTLNNTSSIDFGSNTTGDGNALVISGNVTLTSFTSLAVLDWSGTPFAAGATTDPGTALTQDDLLFASSSNVLTAFGNIALGTSDSQISFYGDNGTFLGNGEFVQVTGGTDSGDYELVAIAAVPEPGTWAMMLAGMGILIVLQRRRRA